MVNQKKYYKWGCVVLGMLLLSVVFLGAFATIWLRQQITYTADKVRILEREHLEIERRHRFLTAKIAQLHTPESLKEKVNAYMMPPSSEQMIWVARSYKSPNADQNLLANANLAISFELPYLYGAQ